MKRTLFLAMSMVTFLSVHAQQAGNYLADKLPGLRTRAELVNFLHNEGFEAKVDTAYMGIGDYKGHEIRFSSDKEGVLHRIETVIPVKGKKWQDVYGAYSRLKNRFITHHGAPIRNVETFRNVTYPEQDKEKMVELCNGNCDYWSTFVVAEEREAMLRLGYDQSEGACIRMNFIDKPGNPHLRFMKIRLDGPLDAFVQALMGDGFNVTRKNEETATLKGTFAGFDNSEIHVFTNSTSMNVKSVLVSFPHKDEWLDIMGVYTPLAKMLKEKYGNPTSESGKYSLHNVPESPLAELYDITQGKTNYNVTFKSEGGVIVLSILPELQVVLVYGDDQNRKEERKAAIDDL